MRGISTSRETARLTVHAALGDLEMLAATYRDHVFARHSHPTYVLGVVTSGVERFRTGRTVNIATAGSILAVNPEQPHDGEKGCEGGWSYRTCYPSTTLIGEIADELGLSQPPMFESAILPASDLARSFVAAHRAADDHRSLECESRMLIVLRAILERFGHPRCVLDDRPRGGAAARVEAYDAALGADPGACPRLSDLAAAAGVTRFQVIRDFKQAAGMTPGQYVRDRRVRRACRLIGSGLPLSAVAAEAGFADQSHLTRAFRAVKGVTPAAYRRAIAG